MARRKAPPGLAETPSDEPAPEPHYLGHRDRLRERFLQADGNLPDYEIVELLLCAAIPRRDVKREAKALLARFGSFAEMLGAPVERIAAIDGVTLNAAIHLKVVAEAAQRFARGAVAERPVLSSWNAVIEYCRTKIAFKEREQFHLLFLDNRNALIADEKQGEGSVNHTPAYPREVVRRALAQNATALILVHNHPSGDPTPSAADIAMTREIAAIAKPLGIAIHDHIIVGRNGHASLKGLKLF
jgi:DNA repair protein RadC